MLYSNINIDIHENCDKKSVTISQLKPHRFFKLFTNNKYSPYTVHYPTIRKKQETEMSNHNKIHTNSANANIYFLTHVINLTEPTS